MVKRRVRDAFEEKLHAGNLRRWARAAVEAETMELTDLRDLRKQTKQLRRELDRVSNVVEGRLIRSRSSSGGIRKPSNTDWAHRSEIWRGPIVPFGVASIRNKTRLGTEATIYHDCPLCELSARQVPNHGEKDLAPFGLRLDVFRFEGSFLSLVVDLPSSLLEGLGKQHILRVAAEIDVESPLKIFARLNIKSGPNTEEIVAELPLHSGDIAAEFDLGHTKLNEKRLERVWVDIIFNAPDMNEVILRDLTFTRRPRAEF